MFESNQLPNQSSEATGQSDLAAQFEGEVAGETGF